jgi:hypothetical protein
MKAFVFALLAVSATITGCAWKTVYIDAPNETVVFAIDRKGLLGRQSRLIRCQGPGACVEVHSP